MISRKNLPRRAMELAGRYSKQIEELESENARLRLALTDAHDVTAEARAQMKRDVRSLLDYKYPAGVLTIHGANSIHIERERLRAAIEAL